MKPTQKFNPLGKARQLQNAFTELTFRDIHLSVSSPVYCPAEDSFLLAKAVQGFAVGSVLDLGTGSGIQAIVAAKKNEVNHVTAVDLNKIALSTAQENAKANHAEKKIAFVHSNLFENVTGKFDVIVFNPPYVPVEADEKLDDESMAWHGGATGRTTLDPFLSTFANYLQPNGTLLLLQSSLNNPEQTITELKKQGFTTEIHSTDSFFFEKIFVLVAIRA